MKPESITARQAQRVLEDLRKGIPPSGFLECFTVGREDQIAGLHAHLNGTGDHALLLKANYGSGKSHLLQLVREKALLGGFATSMVVLDSKSGVRFNRMDQMLGAILRNLKIKHAGGLSEGLAPVLDFFAESAETARCDPTVPGRQFWAKVSNNWSWDYSEKLASRAFYVAFRAWAVTDSQPIRDLILDWLSFPHNYRNRRRDLYEALVGNLRRYFRDPRSERQFHLYDVFWWHAFEHKSCWSALEDIQQMCVASEIPGMVILFDEFEDVLTNLHLLRHKEAAFWNLFRFVSGDRFSGKTFFAVTPSFAQKCKQVLMGKGCWDFDYSRFDQLPTFEMSPLDERDLLELASRIASVHEKAYSYELLPQVRNRMNETVSVAAMSAVQDRARQAIRLAVTTLDANLE